MDKDLENTAALCKICTSFAKEPTKVQLQQWPVPPGPSYRMHIDFAGPFENTMLFILVDAFSKWPEVFVMQKVTTADTTKILESLFSRYGWCKEIV